MPAPVKVLFVCVGNSCRSQMAEALARHHASDVIEAASAGILPLGSIMEKTTEVLEERGISLAGQYSKGLRETRPFQPDLIVNMTETPGTMLFPHDRVIDWRIQDPYPGGMETYRRICDDIEARVKGLAELLRAEAQPKA
jgi:arsenate reductase